ncbi:MAG TPA: hypothetical protein VH372_15640 [Actinospica sp.]|jgi:hypothetical protein|nr:hypothetical protein [Actinospica sp.]
MLAPALALALAEADAAAVAAAFAEAAVVADAEAEAEVFTELATGAGEAGFEVVCELAAACAGMASAVAAFGVVDGECARVIAAATPPGPPTTVPASAATVIAGYLRVHDPLASERTIGLLRLCFE